MGGNEIVVNAYIGLIKEQTEANRSGEVMAQARRLGEKLREIRESGKAGDRWTSRPISFFTKPVELEDSNYIESHGLAQIFDQALSRAFTRAGSYIYVDRDSLQIILEEQERSLDLSSDRAALLTGEYVAARLLVGGSFQQLTPESLEKFYLEITDVESTAYKDSPSIEISVDTKPDEFLIAIADSLITAVEDAYPLRGRLYDENGKAMINIGTEVGVEQGMRFEVLFRSGWSTHRGFVCHRRRSARSIEVIRSARGA